MEACSHEGLNTLSSEHDSVMTNFWASACELGEQWHWTLDLVVAEQSVALLPNVIACNVSPGEQLSCFLWGGVDSCRGNQK